MKLIDIINNRIELIKKELEELNSKKEYLKKDYNYSNYEILTEFIKDLKNIEDIRNMDTSNISSIISRYIKKYNYNSLERELKAIKVAYKAKFDKKIKISLDNEQVLFINNYIREVENLIKYLESRIKDSNSNMESLENDIELKERELMRFNELLDKLNINKDMLDEKDFNLINKIVNDDTVSYETKKEILIEFRNYNVNLYKKKEEVVEVKEEVKDNQDIKNLFEEFGFSSTMFKYINKYKKELSNSMNLDEARKILQYLTDTHNIINRFSEADLLAVCTYGTLESVSKMYERLVKDNNHVYSIFYESPTIWVDEIKRGQRKKRVKDGKDMPKENVGALKTSLMKASYDDMLLNNQFFKEHDYDISIKFSKNKLALTTPHKKVLENYKIFEAYGIHKHSKDVSSIFSNANITDRLDRFVELGLLNGFGSTYENVNYIKYNPSFLLSASEAHYAYLYYMREEEPQYSYYHKLFSDSRNGEIRNEYKNSSSLRVKLLGSTKDFIDEKFIMPNEYLRNADYYEDIINNAEDMSIDPNIFDTPEIEDLENKARVNGNEYVYVIGDLTFSRLKVLRNYSILRRYSNEIYEDTFMYAVARGSYLSEDAVRRVADYIMYTYTNTSTTKGGHHGLLKSI